MTQADYKNKTLDSLSLFVGTGKCNANCAHCAGIVHRKYAPKEDRIVDSELLEKTLKSCHESGANYLSLSSSGEPTLSPISVTKTLNIVNKCKEEGVIYSPVNLYSNGIIIGEDKDFCNKYLPLWKASGLTTLYITIHDIDEKENAKVYKVDKYPSINKVISNIIDTGLLVRANLMLTQKNINTLEKFISTIDRLKNYGVDKVSAWPIRSEDDKQDKTLSPSDEELDAIAKWAKENTSDKFLIRVLLEKNKDATKPSRKVTLFPDGTLSDTWCT
jgi:MoaA/NifB/PqqE/SkfB family radical SAM enzyme